MAQLTQSEVIAEAIIRAGRKAENIDLKKEFSFILKDMSKEKPVLADIATGTFPTNTSYVALPDGYRSQRMLDVGGRYRRRYSALKVGDNWLNFLSNPTDIYYLDLTESGIPMLYSIEATPGIHKIYTYPRNSTGPTYQFHFFKIHPQAWKTWAGLSAKTDISFTASTKTIAQVAAGFDVEACAVGRKLTVSGSASNNGTYTIVSATTAAVVVAEALSDEAAGATVTITVESEGNYLHLYGVQWDDVVIDGVAWRGALKIKEREIAAELKASYDDKLDEMAYIIGKRPTPRVMYHHF